MNTDELIAIDTHTHLEVSCALPHQLHTEMGVAELSR